jgi:hypothetical protein
MSKAYLFAMFLLAASFTGCIGGDDLEELPTEEEEIIEPVGVDDNAGMPVVEFIGIADEDGVVYLIGSYYDDGYILSYSIESTNPSEDDDYGDYCAYGPGLYLKDGNSTIEAEYDCYPIYRSFFIEICYDLEHVDQTITAKIEDNDGNKASAEYELVEDDFDACEDEEDYYGEVAPIATFFVEKDSSGVYHISVIQVSEQKDLTGFSFFLKDETGSTYVGGNGFGEIAMQMIAGEEYGIDMAYDGYDDQLKSRATNVSNDDGTDYPVHFSDNDRDDKLSAGDQFLVYGEGNGANGPAADGWKLEIQFDASGDIVGTAQFF